MDARIFSGWSLTVDGQPLQALAAEMQEPYRALFVGRVPRSDGFADSLLIVERLREVGAGIEEQVTVRNYSRQPAQCVIALAVEADFAVLFEVKEVMSGGAGRKVARPAEMRLSSRAFSRDVRKSTVVQATDTEISSDAVVFRASLPATGSAVPIQHAALMS